MKIILITPLGRFESGDDDAVTMAQMGVIISKKLARKEAFDLVTDDGTLIAVPWSIVDKSVIQVTGCKPNPEPEKKPNLAVVE